MGIEVEARIEDPTAPGRPYVLYARSGGGRWMVFASSPNRDDLEIHARQNKFNLLEGV